MADDELDKILDSSLEPYSAIEPLAGLEVRILQRLAAERAVKSKRVSRWACVVAGSALTVIAMFTLVRDPPMPVETDLAVTVSPPTLPLLAPEQRFSLYVRAVHVKTGRGTQPPPKQAVFPLSAPMTMHEKELVRFATGMPQQRLREISEWQNQPATPISIEPVQIEPLNVDDSPGGASDYVE